MTTRRVKIIGAGSIGNHLAQAARRMGWEVTVVDRDKEALRRMKEEIYPKRYGSWDEAIELFESGSEPCGGFDIVCVGTPPDVRLKIAEAALAEKPRLIQLEKPLAPPLLTSLPNFVDKVRQSGVIACVGYDHVVSQITRLSDEILKSGRLGEPQTLDAEFRVHWGDIFVAHPWLKGPQDSYLGDWQRGGGASGEHSHAVNLWQHFSRTLGQGRVKEVSATLRYAVDDQVNYDKLCLINLVTETGFTGRVVQDVVTKPPRQFMRFQGSNGFLECYLRWNKDGDLVRWQEGGGSAQEKFFPKQRPDDFYQEMRHFQDLLDDKSSPEESPLSLERGLDTLLVIAAAHLSSQSAKTVRLNYDNNYGPSNLEVL